MNFGFITQNPTSFSPKDIFVMQYWAGERIVALCFLSMFLVIPIFFVGARKNGFLHNPNRRIVALCFNLISAGIALLSTITYIHGFITLPPPSGPSGWGIERFPVTRPQDLVYRFLEIVLFAVIPCLISYVGWNLFLTKAKPKPPQGA
jgi:hypothetical protein